MTIRAVLAIAIALFATAFALQNSSPVTVTFVAWRFESSLALVLIFTLMLGAMIVAILAAPAAIRHRWEIADRDGRLATLQRRVVELERRHHEGTARGPGQDTNKLL